MKFNPRQCKGMFRRCGILFLSFIEKASSSWDISIDANIKQISHERKMVSAIWDYLYLQKFFGKLGTSWHFYLYNWVFSVMGKRIRSQLAYVYILIVLIDWKQSFISLDTVGDGHDVLFYAECVRILCDNNIDHQWRWSYLTQHCGKTSSTNLILWQTYQFKQRVRLLPYFLILKISQD